MSIASFTTDFEPEPPDGAKAAEVAAYLDEVIVPDWTCQLSDEHERRVLRQLCEAHSWYWPQVSRKLRQIRVSDITLRGGDAEVSFSEGGVRIFENRFPEPQPLCPVGIRYFHLGHFTDLGGSHPCGSPACRECGPTIADSLLRDIEVKIFPLPRVYVAQVKWDRNLSTRMGQRRRAKGMNTLMYRSVGDLVTIVADQPLTGTLEPKTGREMSGSDAFAWLRDEALWVPGSVSASWSQGWEPTVPGGSPRHVSLEGLTDRQVQTFKKIAAAKARDAYGIEPGNEPLPPEAWNEFRSYLIRIREALRG